MRWPVLAAVLPAALAMATLASVPAHAAQRLNVSHVGSNDVASFTLGANGGVSGVPGSPFDTSPSAGPRGLASTADGRFLYAGNSNNGVEGFAAAPSGVLTLLGGSPFVTGGLAARIAITPDRRFLFAANNDFSSSSISRFSVGANGVLTSLGAATPAGANPFAPAVARGGRFLYHTGNGALNGYTIGADGSLTQLSGLPIGLTLPRGLVASPDGTRLYVALGNDPGEVAGFAVAADGALAPLPGSPYGAGALPEEIAMAPNGRWLFVGRFDGASSSIDQLVIAADGSLSTGASVATGADVGGVAVTADSRFVYGATAAFPSMLFGRAIGPTGALSAIAGLPVPTGGQLPGGDAVAVAPDQPPAARVSARARRSRAVAFDARASSDPDGTPARYDWTFGDGAQLANGGPAPTHVYPRDGAFTAAVVVTDDLGCSTALSYDGRQAVCNGGPGARATVAARADGRAPRISRLRIGKRKKNRTKVTFRLSEAATVIVRLERRGTGRKVGRRCRKQTRRNRSRRSCVRYTRVGSKRLKGKQGANNLTVGKRFGRRLRRGRYRLSVTATDEAGNALRAARKGLRVRR